LFRSNGGVNSTTPDSCYWFSKATCSSAEYNCAYLPPAPLVASLQTGRADVG